MNSEKKLYEELLQEHPELKESQVDIQEVISLMQQMNPEIVADQDYKHALKQRLDTIANYSPQKNHNFIWFIKYFIPVFSFGFAVFGFMYFSGEFQSNIKIETENIAEVNMKISSDMMDEGENVNNRPEGRMLMKASAPINTNENIESDNTSEDIGGEVLDELMPMMFSMDSMIEDTPEDMNISESENMESMSMSIMSVDTQSEVIDIFADICGEYNGLLEAGEDGVRTCILDNENCYENTYQETECFQIK